MLLVGVLIGIVIGMLGTLRVTSAVVKRIRSESYAGAYHKGFEDGRSKGEELPPAAGRITRRP